MYTYVSRKNELDKDWDRYVCHDLDKWDKKKGLSFSIIYDDW